MLTEKVGGSSQVAGGRREDYFDVMAFPVHLPTPGATRGRLGGGAEIGEGTEIDDGEPEGRIGRDGVTERRDGVVRISGLLRVAIEGGGLDVRRDSPTVILDGATSSRGRLDTGDGGPFSVAIHDYQVALVA